MEVHGMRASRNPTGCVGPIVAGIALWLLGIGSASAIAQATAGSPLCAARDLMVIILIEEHAAANDIASERLSKAGLAQMDARLACSAGRVGDAVALYDGIIASLGPILSRRAR
jgi:hypothetical protein